MDKKLFFTLSFFIFFLGVAHVMYRIFAPFFPSLLWATFLVVVFWPVQQALIRRFRLEHKPERAALLMCLGLTFLILLPCTILLIFLIGELMQGAQNLTQIVQKMDIHKIQSMPPYIFIQNQLSKYVDIATLDIQGTLLNAARRISQLIIDKASDFLKIFSSFFIIFALVELNMFFFFRDGERILGYFQSLIPISATNKSQLFSRMREVINASILVGLAAAGTQGLLGGLAFTLLGISSPILWGSLMVPLAFIPVVGTALIWLPAVVFLFINGAPFKAVLLLIWCTVIMGFVDNIIRPLLMNRFSTAETRLHTLLLFFSVLGGLQLFGVLGLVLAPLCVVVTITLIEMVRLEFGLKWPPETVDVKD